MLIDAHKSSTRYLFPLYHRSVYPLRRKWLPFTCFISSLTNFLQGSVVYMLLFPVQNGGYLHQAIDVTFAVVVQLVDYFAAWIQAIDWSYKCNQLIQSSLSPLFTTVWARISGIIFFSVEGAIERAPHQVIHATIFIERVYYEVSSLKKMKPST
jgi:hypothetical protein